MVEHLMAKASLIYKYYSIYVISISDLSENCYCWSINAVLIILLHRLQQPMSAHV